MNYSSLLWTRTFIDWHSVFFHLVPNGNHVEDYNITLSGVVCKFRRFCWMALPHKFLFGGVGATHSPAPPDS